MKKLLALIAAGVAVKYFLDTEKGKKLQTEIKDWLGEAQNAMNDTVDKASGKVKQASNNME